MVSKIPSTSAILCFLNNYHDLLVAMFCGTCQDHSVIKSTNINTYCVPVRGSAENTVGIEYHSEQKQAKSLPLKI